MHKKPRISILIVENDAEKIAFLKYHLHKEGYIVNVEKDISVVLERAKLLKPNLILSHNLDICRILGEETATAHIPIIMMSNQANGIDTATSLNLGADDYLVKPYTAAELTARIRAVLRRLRPAFVHQIVSYADIEMNLGAHKVSRNSKEVRLSPIQFQILQILMLAPKRVFSREDLIHRIWGYDASTNSRTLEVHISKLRRALLQASRTGEDIIKTENGAGYTLRSRIGL
jgi:two-component system, OmpR family, phosphate regulon response regulator PhoB